MVTEFFIEEDDEASEEEPDQTETDHQVNPKDGDRVTFFIYIYKFIN